MIASSEPCGKCKCCEAGTSCSRVLTLAPKDRAFLQRMEALGVGQSDGTIQLRTSTPQQRAHRADPPEPTVEVVCERCREPFAVATFIVETFKARGFTPRRCEACRYAGKERADLA